ncbi:MAG: class I SAM-dependent methyltransferase [bacterium]|nr:class I SAM-dependent methyltransferase [bacterium]
MLDDYIDEISVCDYSEYDYKKHFWNNSRINENICDNRTLKKLLKKIKVPTSNVMDAGCGFGRLFNTYSRFGKKFFLLDYAFNMLSEAKNEISSRFSHSKNNVFFLNANVYNIPILSTQMDLVIAVRLIHHIVSIEVFFQEIYRVLKPGGYFIFEIPNKRHILNIIRYFSGRSNFNPFDHKPYYLSKTFINYHPGQIIKNCINSGFTVKSSINTSFFRNPFLKKLFPAFFLNYIDYVFQSVFSFLNLAPSIFVLCQKPVYFINEQ